MIKMLAINTTTGLSAAGTNGGFTINQTAPELIGLLFVAITGILGVVFLILMIYAGFIWMTAAGNSKAVDKAKSILIQATIGFVIMLSAYSISSYMIGALGGVIGNGSSSSSSSSAPCMDASCGL